VVGPGEPNHVEGKDLPSEVLRSPEANGQINLSEGVGSVPRYHAVER
jgi:hypothetical protein